jgi:hypothetical protein
MNAENRALDIATGWENEILYQLKFLQRIQRDFMSHTDSVSASLGVPP